MGELNQLWRERYVENEDTSDEERHLLVLRRNVNLILNKLTPTYFTKLLQDFVSLDINTITAMELAVTLLHEKAIKEPLYSHCYAQLTRVLSQELPAVSVTEDGIVSMVTNFRTILLNKCQQEFERNLNIGRNWNSSSLQHTQRNIWNNVMYYRRLQQRLRKNGNAIFIGNLCKTKVISESVILECVLKLLQVPREDNLECLCKLLTTVGREIDQTEEKVALDECMRKVVFIVADFQLSSRIKFALQDLIELRDNNWFPRRHIDFPRPLHEIRMEAAT